MSDARREIQLNAGSSYITRANESAFRVLEGSLLVYIVPLEGGKPGRRELIYEAKPGEIVPGFAYRDLDYRSWAFCFSTLSGCRLEESGAADEELRRSFTEKAGVRNYEAEGFNECLADCYRLSEISGSSFIKKSRRDRAETAAGISGLVSRNLGGAHGQGFEKTGEALYDCAAMLAALNKLPLATVSRVREMYGEDYTVYDIARASQLAYRELRLEGEWYKTKGEACIVAGPGRRPMLCLPRSKGVRVLYDPEADVRIPVTAEVAANTGSKALVLCRTLPPESLRPADLVRFCARDIKKTDIAVTLLSALFGAWAGAAVPLLGWKLIDLFRAGTRDVAGEAIRICLILAALSAILVVFTVISRQFRSKIAGKAAFDAENALYYRVFNMPGEFFRRFDSVDLAGRVIGTGAAVETAVLHNFSGLGSLLSVVAVLAAMCFCSWKLALAGILSVLAVILASVLAGISGSRHNSETARLEGESASIMNQFISGISRIRSAGAEEKAVFEYLGRFIKLRESREKYSKSGTISALAALTAVGLCFAGGFYIISRGAGSDSYSAGEAAAFCILTVMLFMHALRFGRTLFRLLRLRTDFDRARPLLETVPEYSLNTVPASDITGAIELRDVTFAYSPDSPPVLTDIDLKIKAGEYIGIAGPSGCGKSTLLKLLLGFEVPTGGNIYYDTHDLSSLDRHGLRRQMGVVLQEDRLVSGNIRDNICVTAPGASEERIQKAVDAAGLAEDLGRLPMGLNTILSEDGSNVPDGVVQRVLIARALISSPRILIFDEATGALDEKAEKQVRDTLKTLNCTRIVVAHRLSSVADCDRIIVLRGGKIAEQGTWQELVNSGGEFSRLARLS